MKEITRDMFPKEIRECCRESAHTFLRMGRCTYTPCHSCFMYISNLRVGNNEPLCGASHFSEYSKSDEAYGDYLIRVANEYLKLISPTTKLDLTEY